MLHQPSHHSKFHQNHFTHLLNLHTNSTSTTVIPSHNNNDHIEINNKQITTSCNNQHSTLDAVQDQIGKSFTIAAILGLKKTVAAVAAASSNSDNILISNNNSSKNNFNDVMNLSLNHNNININNSHGKIDFNRLGQRFHNQQGHIHNTNSNNLNNSTNSALQSLQQLHHQHTAGTGFHAVRDRQRDNTTKKSSLKSKRVRTIFTPEQLERLEAEFERQQYMVGPERLYLAHTLQLTEAQVKVWFQNRRIKWRKHHLEITHQRLALIRQRQMPNSMQQSILNSNNINNQSDQELTICSDSMDTESMPDVGDDS